MELNKAIEIAKEYLGLKYFDNLSISLEKVDDEKVLKVEKDGNGVTIAYGVLSSLFRGLTILKEHHNENAFSVSVRRTFKTNGYMVDVSRNGIVTNEKMKEMILMQALMGQNRLLVYTEDTYELDNYPYFGYLRGGYSKQDLKSFVEYGESFGVELIPCIQTLGHLQRVFRWYPMEQYKDGPTTLLINFEGTYKLIEEMIKVSRECFKSKDIHIGMDESAEIGVGRYLGLNPYKDRVELFSEHLAKVIQICQKYDFSPMIWSDMFFRLNDKDSEYYRSTPLPQSTIDLIPSGVKLVYWDYYHSETKIYDDMISYHKQAPNEIVFAGGAWRWLGFAPAVQGSFNHSIPAMQSCVANGIDNVFVTSWGDNGNECSYMSVFATIALYTTADFFGVTDENKVDSLLQAVMGETLARIKLMDLPNQPANKCLLPQYNPCKYLFYQDVLSGIFDDQVKEGFNKNYEAHATTLEQAAKESEKYSYIYTTLSKLCSCLSIKAELGYQLRKAYKAGDKEMMDKIVNKDIPELLVRLEDFHETHRAQWYKENRSTGFDVIDGRMGYLTNRLKSARLMVNKYLKGEIDKVEELEATILPYNGFDYEICWNHWETTVTPHNL